MSTDRGSLTTWAGIIGPVLFASVFTIEGWLRPGYHPMGMYVSALSIGERGWIQITSFIVFGTLLLVFSRAVGATFQDGKASRGGPILLSIIAVCLLCSGPFVMDPAGTPVAQMSWHGLVHQTSGAIVFSLMPASCVVFARRFRDDPAWRWFHGWTLAAAAVIVGGIVVQKVGPTRPPAAPNGFNERLGLIQRTELVPYLIWLFTLALGIRRRNRAS